MTPFRDLPIRRKLLLLTLGPTTIALVLASIGFLTWDIAERRREIREDVEAEGKVLPESMAPAISFQRPDEVNDTLALLKTLPRVQRACVYDAKGALFGTFVRDGASPCPPQPPKTARFGWSVYDSLSDITYQNDKAGTLYLSRDMADVHRRLTVGSGIIIGLLVLAVLTALAVARRLERSVSQPLLALAATAQQVSASRDYSLRVEAGSHDEIGAVIRSFNEMLTRISDRTAELSKANDELHYANRLKDEFLATLSHELRTPMNAVLGWARVLRSTSADDATYERGLESIERNARAQARLIEDLLEISRIVTGKLRLQVREVDLAAIVETAVDIVRPAALAKQLQLTTHIGQRPALTQGDPDRLQQVIWNLLSNAVKFTPPGGAVTVRLTRPEGYVLSVEDSGPGIEPKFLPYVFDAFRQADASATREHGGLGLGLAIARQLVEAHGGTIRAESAGTDRGARFDVFLPSHIESSQPRSAATDGVPRDPIDSSLLQGIDVLVVDDDEDARLLMQMTLSSYGAAVTTAASADEALQAIDRAVPDVMLSDIGMPHQDGYDLLRQLRSRPAEQGGTIPAVAVTAYASPTDRSSTEAAGYQAHVAKPFEPAYVARLVRRLVTTDHARTT